MSLKKKKENGKSDEEKCGRCSKGMNKAKAEVVGVEGATRASHR